METGRVGAFSDGVFAIAITLLILTIEPPSRGQHLGHELLRLWPSYLAYAFSFLTVGIMWVNHHTIFRHFARVDRPLLLLNILLLMLIAFVPFPTRVAAEFIRSGDNRREAALLYGITMTITAVFFLAVWFYGSTRLLLSATDMREVSGITRSYLPGPLMYGAATLIAFASGAASLILFAAIAVFYAVSASFFGRDA